MLLAVSRPTDRRRVSTQPGYGGDRDDVGSPTTDRREDRPGSQAPATGPARQATTALRPRRLLMEVANGVGVEVGLELE